MQKLKLAKYATCCCCSHQKMPGEIASTGISVFHICIHWKS